MQVDPGVRVDQEGASAANKAVVQDRRAPQATSMLPTDASGPVPGNPEQVAAVTVDVRPAASVPYNCR